MSPDALKLQIGRAYFLCGYYLRNRPIPDIETWIYIGTNIFEEDKTEEEPHHYFERPEVYFAKEIAEETAEYRSYEADGDTPEDLNEPRFRVAESELVALVYDYQGLRKWVAALGEEPNADDAF